MRLCVFSQICIISDLSLVWNTANAKKTSLLCAFNNISTSIHPAYSSHRDIHAHVNAAVINGDVQEGRDVYAIASIKYKHN